MNIRDFDSLMKLFEKKYSKAYVEWEKEYGEPGYDAGSNGILLGNWNHVPRVLQDWLENNGYSLEWSDEWIRSDIGKIYRTSPTSYCWKPSFVIMNDCDVVGKDEILDGTCMVQYIEHLLNDPNCCDMFNVDWTKHGFERVNKDSFETGFHAGQTDSPAIELEKAQEQYSNCEFIFQLDENSQFYSTWSLWKRETEE